MRHILRLVDESEDPVLTLTTLQLGGAVAQLGARLDGIEEVVGSNPIGSTKFTHVSGRSFIPNPIASLFISFKLAFFHLNNGQRLAV